MANTILLNEWMKKKKQAEEKDPKKQWIGLRNRAAGHEFEDTLDRTFAWYAERKIASVKKTPEPMRVLRSLGNGQFLACFEKKAQPDYKGTLKGGRSILLEAKYTSQEQMNQDVVSQEQTEFMNENYDLGAACYVVIGFSTGNSYRIPWKVWRDMKEHFGRKYVTEADYKLSQYLLNPGHGGILPILEHLEDL